MVRSPARGFIWDEPLLLLLDEPTAALDAGTEHALFELRHGPTRSACNSVQGATASLAFTASLALWNL
jgi:alpha-D-ribose 1-methylphosphonate 5-triphosphate synthase subunit PhnL